MVFDIGQDSQKFIRLTVLRLKYVNMGNIYIHIKRYTATDVIKIEQATADKYLFFFPNMVHNTRNSRSTCTL